jgi:two-component system OmpR family response regulator
MQILLVEDDAIMGEAVVEALKEARYAVDWVHSGTEAIAMLAIPRYDLVLLDLRLPGNDGFSVIITLRGKGNTLPLLIITARDALEDRLRGLDAGADDFVIAPFDTTAWRARIRAVMRRKEGHCGPVLSNGIIRLDPASHEACDVEKGEVYRLSNREFALLQALLIRPGTLLSRSELEEKIYGWGEEIESNAVEFFIHALRKKFGSKAIKNVRGVGWKVSGNA